LVLELIDEGDAVFAEGCNVQASLGGPRFVIIRGCVWPDVAQLHEPGKPIGLGLNDHHGIEPEQAEVGEVVVAEALSSEVGVDEANAAKAPGACPVSLQVGDEQLMGVPDNHVADPTPAVDHHTELPVQGPRHFGQTPSEIR